MASVQHYPPVYGLGYSGRSVQDIRRIVAAVDGCLIDIRLAPYSRRAEFRKAALERAFGDRYLHLPALGNPNYKFGGPLALADYDAGRAVLAALDRPAFLLCVCADAGSCHRTLALQRLAEDGFQAQEWADQGASPLPLG